MNNEEMLNWAEFVASKFGGNHEGWVYSRDKKDLKHVRYESDYTGYNHWTKRLGRFLGEVNPVHYLRTPDRWKASKSFKDYGLWVAAYFHVYLRKDDNLPDGMINGILTTWEEDGEYLAFFQPRVGMKVLEFLKKDPENPYAIAIRDEMRNCIELSWPTEDAE